MNITHAARELGVSTRTIRRYIKAGKIKAKLVTGKFGSEYQIAELPQELLQQEPVGEKPTANQSSARTSSRSLGQAMDIIRELQEKNLALAAQLGVATERVRNLENQVKLLSTVKKPWWKKLFGITTVN
ncbi:MAG: MerR family transcriptional regulator [Dehalococcoidia bacterium]|nr:MAG: MerR family transcriptional regulator [Dehalococcoidia bacterium]